VLGGLPRFGVRGRYPERVRVLITADLATARRQLQAVATLGGHTVLDSAELGAGALLATAAWTADAVVAGLFASRPSREQLSAVLVEAGIALGRGVPVLLLTRPGIAAPALTGVPRIEANLEDSETLALKLELFLQGVDGGVPRRTVATSAGSPKRDRLPTYAPGYQLEETVASLLEVSGSALILATYPDGPDFAFYLQGRETDLGLVLAEVKHAGGEHWQRRIREASHQLARYVAQANAGFGLVIYDGDNLPHQRRTSDPFVVAISLESLRSQLEERSLEDVVWRLRNEAIHGLS
jgi:hypothetical protein